MCTSTTAYLFYGLCWTVDDTVPWLPDEHDDTFDERYFRLREGVTRATHGEGYHQLLFERRPNFPCTLIRHCSDECTMYGLAIRASVIEARRGYPARVPSFLAIDPSWAQRLQETCALVGIPHDQEPAWHLVSWWG